MDRYQNTGGTNIVAQTTFAYDTLNRLTDLDHKQSSTTLVGAGCRGTLTGRAERAAGGVG